MILDCTIRDGGHLCEWNFSKNFVDEVYDAACKSGVDFFEIGYRMHSKSKGLYSVCPDEILPSGESKIVVMVNVSDFDVNDFADNGKYFVRVACHYDEVDKGIIACEQLKEKGYGVFLHIMNIDMFEYYSLIKNWQNKDIIESLYFADSYGSLTPDKIEMYFNKLRDAGYERISFHGHNNIQLAYANSLKALELGAYSVDGTAYGMGRGGGNLPIELLLGDNNGYYVELIKKYFVDLKDKYKWGYNLNSMETGIKNVHPNKTLL